MKDSRVHYCPESGCRAKTYQHQDIQYVEAKDDYVYVWICGNCGAVVPKRVTSPRASRIENFQTPSQKKAISWVESFIENDLDFHEKYGAEITTFETKTNEYDGSVWLRVETELLGLPENNLLRALSHEFWSFLISRHGKVEAYSYPDSFEQFKGRKVFQKIHVK